MLQRINTSLSFTEVFITFDFEVCHVVFLTSLFQRRIVPNWYLQDRSFQSIVDVQKVRLPIAAYFRNN